MSLPFSFFDTGTSVSIRKLIIIVLLSNLVKVSRGMVLWPRTSHWQYKKVLYGKLRCESSSYIST